MMQSLTTRWRNAESRKPERLITGPGLVTRNQAFSRVPWGAGAGLRMEAHRSKHVPGALHRSESKLLGRDGCNSCLPPSFTCLAAIDLQVSICTLFLLSQFASWLQQIPKSILSYKPLWHCISCHGILSFNLLPMQGSYHEVSHKVYHDSVQKAYPIAPVPI